MAGTKLIRDHHLLTRNLKLNDNYISNDGGDEGITVSDSGVVTMSSQLDIGNMSLTTSELDVSSGNFTLDAAGDIIFDAGGGEVNFINAGSTTIEFDTNGQTSAGASIKLMSILDDSDYFMIDTTTLGVTTISTVDDGNNEAAHLTFDIQGDTIFKGDIADGTSTEVARIDSSASSLLIASGKKIEFADTAEYITSDGTDLTIVSGGKVLIDKDLDNTTASNSKALHIDLDRTGTVSSGTDTTIGIDLDVNHTGASGGTIISYGLDIDVIGETDTSATSSATGLSVDVSGADTCSGIYIRNKNGGTDFKNVSSESVVDYFKINTIAAGATTLTTVDTTVGATAHLNMVADGDFTVDAEGDIILNADGGKITLSDGLGAYTPSAASDATTKKYVDSVMYDHRVCNYASTSALIQYVPLSGYVLEGALSNANEYRAMVMPYDGSLIRIIWRSEIEQTSGNFNIQMLISDDGTELPTTTNFLTRLPSFTLAANTTYVHDPGVTAAYYATGNESNAFSKGQIIAVGIDPTVAPYDTNCTLVFKYDTST